MVAFLFTPMSLSLTAADTNTELHITLPARTNLIEVTMTANVSLAGMLVSTGNVDGLIACFSVLSNFTLGFLDDSGLASSAANRFRGGASVIQFGASWYRYSSSVSRWIGMGHV